MVSSYEKQYMDNLKNIYDNGFFSKNERTGVCTRRIASSQIIVDLEKEFPFKTQPQNTKDNAIRECHYHALSILKAYKYLDSHLKFNNPNSKYDKIMKDFFRLFNS